MYQAVKSTMRAGRGIVRTVVFRAARMVGSDRYTRFIVLTRHRTGSNMLISLLNANRHIIARGEIFAKLNGRELDDVYDGILRELFHRYPPHIRAAGFKLMYHHPFDVSEARAGLWGKLSAISDLHVIHLKRRNILRAEVSSKIATRTGKWTAKSTTEVIPGEERRVSFEPAELLERFDWTRRQEERFDRELRPLPHLEVAYEDLLTTQQATLTRMGNFLGVKSGRFHTSLRRQNPEPLSDLIVNYAQLKDSFAGTQWSAFFDE